MINVGTVQVILSAVDNRLRSVFKGAEKVVGSFGSGIEGIARRINPFNAIIGAVSVGAVGAFVKKGFEAVDSMAKQADQLGITTERYAGLKLAAIDANASMDDVAQGMNRVNATLLKAREGNEEAISTFAKLGLTAEQLANLPADKQLAIIGERLNSVRDRGDRAAISMELFGKQAGPKMALMLADGSEGLDEQQRRAERLGLTLSRIDAKEVENANDQFSRVWEVIGGIANRLAHELAPYVSLVAEEFLGAAEKTGGFRDAIHSAVEMGVKGAIAVYDFWLRLKEVWQVLKIGVIGVTKGAIDALTYLFGFGENTRKAITAGWNLFRDDVILVWAAIKAKFTAALDFMAGGFSDWLDKLGHTLNRVKDGLGNGMIEAADKVKNATAKMAADADKNWTEASEAATKSQEEFLAASKDIWKVDLDKTSQHIGDFWANWRQNLSDNLGIEISELEKQGNERLSLLAKLERMIVAARQKSREQAQRDLAKKGPSGGDASTDAILEAQRKARSEKLSKAEQDPDVLYARRVLDLIKQGYDRAQAQQIADDEKYRTTVEQDPATDAKVAYAMRVSDILKQIDEEANRAEEERVRRHREAMLSAYSTIAGNMDQITATIADQSLAGFRAHQATSIASALVNAWLGYSQALAAPDVPQYLKQAMAVSALGAGFAAANQIAAQKPSGRATGGAVQSHGLYQVGEGGRPELLSMGGKNYLLMGDRSGSVNPASPGGAGRAKVEVHVHTPPGTSARTTESQGPGGQPRIDVIVEQVEARIAGSVANGSGALPKALERTYGVNRSRGAMR